MATKERKLSIERRDGVGTPNAHKLRASGKIPAVIYGHGSDPQHVAIELKAFEDLLHGGGRSALITLTEGGKKSDTALVRDVQRHAVSRKIVHADLQLVTAHEAVRAKLPLVAVGISKGVRDFAGVMDVIVYEIDVEGPVDELPEHLEIDVSDLGIHEHATAGDIKLPKGIKLLTPADTNVVSIEPSKTAAQLEEAVSGVTPEQVDPEIIGQKSETE